MYRGYCVPPVAARERPADPDRNRQPSEWNRPRAKVPGRSLTISCCHGASSIVRLCLLPGPCWGNRHGQCREYAITSVQPTRCRVQTLLPGTYRAPLRSGIPRSGPATRRRTRSGAPRRLAGRRQRLYSRRPGRARANRRSRGSAPEAVAPGTSWAGRALAGLLPDGPRQSPQSGAGDAGWTYLTARRLSTRQSISASARWRTVTVVHTGIVPPGTDKTLCRERDANSHPYRADAFEYTRVGLETTHPRF